MSSHCCSCENTSAAAGSDAGDGSAAGDAASPAAGAALPKVKFFGGEQIPLELHKVRVVQKLHLVPVERRLAAIREAHFNDYQLQTTDVFLDMLTDSGVNAMSDNQTAAMHRADDAYAGSQSFARMRAAVNDVLGKKFLLPAHQGRACENIISRAFVKPGDILPMNYHFTTTLAHIMENGGKVVEILYPDALQISSTNPFKGNMDTSALEKLIAEHGAKKIPFIRMEASTNLIGGQPFSMANLREVRRIADKHGIMLVLDASLIGENCYFIKKREPEFANSTVAEILLQMCDLAHLVYFSARKLSSSRGGGICTNDEKLYDSLKNLVVLYEGFITYGGMSVREIESIAVGLRETTDETVISQSPSFIEYFVNEAVKRGIPMVTPPGGLGAHIDAGGILPHVPREEYQAGSFAVAYYIAGGIRGMERGTVSSIRDPQTGKDILSDVELLRLAFPRRVFTLSQTKYALDRLDWLYQNRSLIGGLRFVEEPPVLRFFNGKLAPTSDWPEKLAAKFRADFGDSL
ncbi:MAG: tryptophanase [Puniceicoccales bacterium]|jgi:tryptophanase|nr:tryptophanase [Puniceicoccales bacterium]